MTCHVARPSCPRVHATRDCARQGGTAYADEAAGEMVAKVAPFWHRCSIVRPPPWVRPEFGRGCSSGVEHDLAKVGVEGSNPFARSKILNDINKLTRQDKSRRYCCLGGEAWGKQMMGNRARSRLGSVLHMKSPDAAPATLGTA